MEISDEILDVKVLISLLLYSLPSKDIDCMFLGFIF